MASSCAISIIIPTYNVESYIARCLESCTNQSLRDIEILVIDDCGSDSSIQIAQDYAKLDSRIKIIHNESNLGTFATRIVGIRRAVGEYALFVDADDYLHVQACELLYKHITQHNADILHFKAHYPAAPKAPLLAKLTHYTRYILPTRFCKAPLYNEQIASHFFLDSRQFPKFTLWDKCYDAELLRQACEHFTASHFTPIVADDLLFFLVIASLATSYISIDKRLYFYCLNTHSSMQNPSKRMRRIESFSYVANTLHTLELDSSLLPQIVRTMSQDLAALIILESRFVDSIPSSAQSAKIARWGGGSARIYTSSAHTPCGSRAYPSTQDSSIYASYSLTLSALLHSIAAVLGTLPYLYSYVCLYCKFRQSQALVAPESTFTKVNSASGEQCGSIAKIAKGTNAKFANLPQFLQSSHSPTAKQATAVQGKAAAGFFRNLRILEEENNQTALDSSVQVDCHANASALARNDSKLDSTTGATTLHESAQDSKTFTQNAQILHESQAAGFADDFVGCRVQSKGAYLAYVTAALRDDSRKSAAKPTPKPRKAESTSHLDKVAYAA